MQGPGSKKYRLDAQSGKISMILFLTNERALYKDKVQ